MRRARRGSIANPEINVAGPAPPGHHREARKTA
jgi:hypothetical protein